LFILQRHVYFLSYGATCALFSFFKALDCFLFHMHFLSRKVMVCGEKLCSLVVHEYAHVVVSAGGWYPWVLMHVWEVSSIGWGMGVCFFLDFFYALSVWSFLIITCASFFFIAFLSFFLFPYFFHAIVSGCRPPHVNVVHKNVGGVGSSLVFKTCFIHPIVMRWHAWSCFLILFGFFSRKLLFSMIIK